MCSLLDPLRGPRRTGAARLGKQSAVARDYGRVDVRPVVPEMKDGRGVADREARYARVGEADAELLVLGAPAEPLIIAVDSQDVVEERRGVAAFPWRAPRGERFDDAPERSRERVATLVAGGPLEGAGI